MNAEDAKKMKVTELREALKARGLDTKGVKAVLVKRLVRSLAEEAGEEVGDESLNESGLNESSYDTAHEESVTESTDKSVEQAQEAVEITDDDEEEEKAVEQTPAVEAVPDEQPVVIEDDEETTEAAPVEEAAKESDPEPMAEEEPPVEEAKEETDKQETEPEPEPAKQESEPVPVQEKEEPMQESNEEPIEIKSDDTTEKTEGTKEETNDEPEKKDEEELKMETEGEQKQEESEETVGPNGEVFKVMDSVGEVDPVLPVVERDDRSSRKRHRSRSRSPHRRHRSRHSRSRSPRRRSRSADRKRRSKSKERRGRSGSRDRYGRDRTRDSYGQRKEPDEPEDWIDATNVRFDKFNCDLHIRIKEEGYKCNPITVEGFAFMWAGVRSNYGFTKGKVAMECKILEHLNVDHLPEEEKTRHVVRVGFSTDSSSMQLGEEKFSYGYGGTGKASTECKFKDFGEKFGEGDVIGAYLDMDSDPMTISYSKNGTDLGVCFEIDRAELGEQALFAHILSKNSEFEVNFGQLENPHHPLNEGFAFLNDIPEGERVRGTKPPAKKDECEMIMMCGLPGAGKTHWATKYAQENPEKRYNVLGTNNIIDKMKVMGLPRKGNYSGRWDVLIDKSTKCLARLLEIASKKKRNFILDQTNVYPTAQRRKMRPFEGFQRRAVVIVPTDEVFKERCEKREKEEGKEIPDNAVWEMKANFQLPEEGQCFDKVEFVELGRDEAKELVEKYNKEGNDNLPSNYKRYRGPDRYADRDRNRSYSGGNKYDSSRDRYRTDHRSGRGSRGSYLGYSNNDRQRADRYSGDRDRDRDSYRDSRSGGRSYSGGSSSYGSGGYNNSYGSGSGSSWGQGQGSGWGNQNQGSGWGNQSSWGNQGWGNQGYGSNQQWSGYNQQQQPSGSQGWGNQGYYSGYGNYGYGYGNQQGGWGGYGGGSSH